MHTVAIVALSQIGPIADKNTAIRPIFQGNAAEPWIVSHEEVLAVASRVPGTFSFEPVLVNAVAVQIAHEDRIAITVGPSAPQVDHGAGMGIAAASILVDFLACVAARKFPVLAGKVVMVRTGVQQVVSVWRILPTVNPLVVSSGD